MIKIIENQHNKLVYTTTNPKTIIFDLSGVLLIKKTDEMILNNRESCTPMAVVNFSKIISILKACKAAGHKLFILSNLSVQEYDAIRQEPQIASLFSFFNDIMISEMTPFKKPDHQIFTYFCQQYNLQPSDCVFIDDKQKNLDGAQIAHITKTILCSQFDFEHIYNQLIAFGILDHACNVDLDIPTGQA